MRTRIVAINVIGCEAADEQIHSRSVFSHQQISQMAVRRELVFDKLKQIAARSFGNVFCHMFCVLRARPREVDHESVAVGITRRVGRLRFRARLRIVIDGRIGAGGEHEHRHAQNKAQKNN